MKQGNPDSEASTYTSILLKNSLPSPPPPPTEKERKTKPITNIYCHIAMFFVFFLKARKREKNMLQSALQVHQFSLEADSKFHHESSGIEIDHNFDKS